MDDLVAAFLARGGKVTKVAQGDSATARAKATSKARADRRAFHAWEREVVEANEDEQAMRDRG